MLSPLTPLINPSLAAGLDTLHDGEDSARECLLSYPCLFIGRCRGHKCTHNNQDVGHSAPSAYTSSFTSPSVWAHGNGCTARPAPLTLCARLPSPQQRKTRTHKVEAVDSAKKSEPSTFVFKRGKHAVRGGGGSSSAHHAYSGVRSWPPPSHCHLYRIN